MKRLVYLAIRLYPRKWRDRYGSELDALIEDSRQTGLAGLLDILKGAITMRIARGPAGQVAAATLAGVLLAAAAWAILPNTYRSTGAATVPGSTTSALLNEAAMKVLSPPEVRELITKHGLGSTDPEQVEEFKHHLTISRVELVRLGTRRDEVHAFSVSFHSRDARTSQAVAQDVLDRLLRNLPSGASILDAPLLPKRAMSPALGPILFVGTVCGLLLGGILTLLSRRRETS